MVVLGRQQRTIAQGVLVPAGGPLLGQEYFWIYDQSGRLWAWWIAYELAADWRSAPEHDFDQEVRFYIVPWWVKLVDDEGQAWFMYPALDGSPLLDIAQPANGDGIVGSPALRVRGGPQRYHYTVVGGAVDVDPV
jgi:hypothetical protein